MSEPVAQASPVNGNRDCSPSAASARRRPRRTGTDETPIEAAHGSPKSTASGSPTRAGGFSKQVGGMLNLQDVELPSMFLHMFQRHQNVVDKRRRSITLIDVVAESHQKGPIRGKHLLMPVAVAVVYWYLLLPAVRDWGNLGVGVSDRGSPRAGGPWSEVSWRSACFVTAVYLLGALVGAHVMKQRPPVEKSIFECMLIYNLALALLNFSLALNLVREVISLGYPFPWGNGLDFSPAGHRLGMLIWFHYHCRQLELLDTIFVIARKKFHRMTFLHIYLRVVHMWGWFFACRYACGGDCYFPAVVNCACQVIVYAYYAMSMIREKGVPLMRKAHVTEVQVFQFVLCATHATYVLAFGHLPRAVAAVSLGVMASGLVLYVEWDGGHPHIGPRAQVPVELSMFGHMFENKKGVVDLRRRALTLIDVVSERQLNGPLRPHRLVAAFVVSLGYWYFLLPAFRDWGTGRWYREEHADMLYQHAGGPWAEVNVSVAMVVTLVYLFVVFVGVHVMEKRSPVQKRVFEYMFIYNTTQVMLNTSLSFNLWREAYRLGYARPWGNSVDLGPVGHRLGMLLWFQYHCRQLDLFDTIFIILRKKFHHMSFLHILLRLAHMWGWFVVCRYACGGDSYFPAAVNCTCQVIVYLYYTLSMLHEVGRAPIFRKAHVAEVQLAQFAVCAVHAGYVLYHGNLPRAVAALSLSIMGISLAMYSDFAGDLSKLGDPRPGEPGRLTFRFDSSGWFYAYHFGVAHWLQEHVLPEGMTPEEAATDRYPKGLAFAGSSGGALVGAALACGISVRGLFECVLAEHPLCCKNPLAMFVAVERALQKFLPPNAPVSMSGRLRVLLTRVSKRPPFVTGDVVDQYVDWDDAFRALRATCHVPVLNPLPYPYHGRLYFDGLTWSSLLVPWSGDEHDLVVKVSATAMPLTDIRAPLSPLWWSVFPPSVDVLRGMFWTGYRDAAAWFAAPPNDGGLCGCRSAPAGRLRRQTSNGSMGPNDLPPPPATPTATATPVARSPQSAAATPAPPATSPASPGDTLPDEPVTADPLSRSRHAKYLMGQRLLLKSPYGKDKAMLPETDPACGKSVQELIHGYRRAINRSFKAFTAVAGLMVVVAAAAYLALVAHSRDGASPAVR